MCSVEILDVHVSFAGWKIQFTLYILLVFVSSFFHHKFRMNWGPSFGCVQQGLFKCKERVKELGGQTLGPETLTPERAAVMYQKLVGF